MLQGGANEHTFYALMESNHRAQTGFSLEKNYINNILTSQQVNIRGLKTYP